MRLRGYLRTASAFAGCATWLAAAAHANPPPAATPATIHAMPSAASSPAAPVSHSAAEWRALLSSVPQLALYASEFAIFSPAATKTALERGGRTRENVTTWKFMDGPFEWRPNPKKTLWVVTGSAGPRVVIAVFEPGDKPKHLASTVLLEPEPALAIGWSASEPNRLLWTTCYLCQGLGGSIELNPDGRVAFVYH